MNREVLHNFGVAWQVPRLQLRGRRSLPARAKDIEELINLQEVEGGKCKPYQVKQMREVLLKYNLKQEL